MLKVWRRRAELDADGLAKRERLNYYNDNDPICCAWMRELISADLIPDGEVSDKDVREIRPGELDGFEQVHLFAGIGGWPLALRMAGWSDERSVWTGSCPCQPFSVAGKGEGLDDERHLWPAFRWLVAQCRPPVVFGEQVASKDGRTWLSGVRTDLEALEYAVGAADLCAASVGAPHIRARIWWVADADGDGRQQWGAEQQGQCRGATLGRSGSHGGVGNTENRQDDERGVRILEGSTRRGEGGDDAARTPSHARGMAESECGGHDGPSIHIPTGRSHEALSVSSGTSANDRLADTTHDHGRSRECGTEEGSRSDGERRRRSPSGGGELSKRAGECLSWADEPCCWHLCRDGKLRRIPTQPELFPLAHGVPGRVGLLRGSGNAIVPQVAAAFVMAFMESSGNEEVERGSD